MAMWGKQANDDCDGTLTNTQPKESRCRCNGLTAGVVATCSGTEMDEFYSLVFALAISYTQKLIHLYIFFKLIAYHLSRKQEK